MARPVQTRCSETHSRDKGTQAEEPPMPPDPLGSLHAPQPGNYCRATSWSHSFCFVKGNSPQFPQSLRSWVLVLALHPCRILHYQHSGKVSTTSESHFSLAPKYVAGPCLRWHRASAVRTLALTSTWHRHLSALFSLLKSRIEKKKKTFLFTVFSPFLCLLLQVFKQNSERTTEVEVLNSNLPANNSFDRKPETLACPTSPSAWNQGVWYYLKRGHTNVKDSQGLRAGCLFRRRVIAAQPCSSVHILAVAALRL